jgi:H/ACA ribonucleoprotein complex subunit 3
LRHNLIQDVHSLESGIEELMKTSLRKCSSCQEYTLKAICPRCGQGTDVPIPARFSPDDRYGKYRRMLLVKRR